MPTVIITVGIPASGKTYWSNAYVKDHPDTVISCRDDIRAVHDLPYGKPEVERYITTLQRVQINEALLDGHDVIVADTNLVNRFRQELITFSHRLGADVQTKLFPIELDEAIRRDAQRTAPVGEAVVRRFYTLWETMDPIEPLYQRAIDIYPERVL